MADNLITEAPWRLLTPVHGNLYIPAVNTWETGLYKPVIGHLVSVNNVNHVNDVTPVERNITPLFTKGNEISLQGRFRIAHLDLPVNILVDTGCRIPYVFRNNLVPVNLLQSSHCPISIKTADGSVMEGGQRGCYATLVIPSSDAIGNQVYNVCAPYWGYEANIGDVDVILGYPFLKSFQFTIQCVNDKLCRRLRSIPMESTPARSTFDNLLGTGTPVNAVNGGTVGQFNSPGKSGMTPRSGPPDWHSHLGLIPTSHAYRKDAVVPVIPTSQTSKVTDGLCSPTSTHLQGTSEIFSGTDLLPSGIPSDKPTGIPVLPETSLRAICGKPGHSISTKLSEARKLVKPPITPFRYRCLNCSRIVNQKDMDCCLDWKEKVLIDNIETLSVNLHNLHTLPGTIYTLDTLPEHYTIVKELFDIIYNIAEQQDLTPVIDAFASANLHFIVPYWSKHSNAFNKTWRYHVLWIHPPARLLFDIINKINIDNARGILLLPHHLFLKFYNKLQPIVFFWWTLLPEDIILMDGNQHTLSHDIPFTVCFFNACIYLTSPLSFENNLSHYQFTNKTHLHIRSVIEHSNQLSQSDIYIEKIKNEFNDVLQHPLYASDMDPLTRGPFGIAHIELKEGAKPLKKRFFRSNQERETALEQLITKMIANGWIEPSKSEWAAQAFLVPKPANIDGTKEWRLVVDYRYLNSQTKDYPFPLPLIEDLIAKQTENRIWSIFDLQDGFHQMHLHESCRECTAFITPRGLYHWTVLPMGVKNGPAMFQAMITWVLRETSHAIVYVDDILVGTKLSENKDDNIELSELSVIHYNAIAETLNIFRKHHLFVKGS